MVPSSAPQAEATQTGIALCCDHHARRDSVDSLIQDAANIHDYGGC